MFYYYYLFKKYSKLFIHFLFLFELKKVFTFLILIGWDFQSCRSTEGVELKTLSPIHSLTWHSPLLQFSQEFLFLPTGLNYVTFCVITPRLSIRDDCCLFLIFIVFCVFICFPKYPLPYIFLSLEQTCDNRADSFVSTWDLLDHYASQILLRGYRVSTRHSGRSYIFCGFNLLELVHWFRVKIG